MKPCWLIWFCLVILQPGVAQSPTQLLEKAEEQQKLRHYQEALTLYTRCITKDAGQKEAYLGRAQVLARLGKPDEALTDYNIYLSFHPDHYEALFSRASLRYEQELYEPAREDFLRLLQLPPGETSTVYFELDRYTGGVTNVFTAQGKNSAAVLHFLGLIEMKLLRCESALHYYDSAIRLAPDQSAYYLNRGQARRRCGDTTGWRQDTDKVRQLSRPTTNLYQRLAEWEGQDLTDEDLAELDLIIETLPKSALPYALRADHRLRHQRYREAEQDLTAALRCDSLDADLWYNRGLAREHLRAANDALRDYTVAVSLNEEHERAWLNRGNVFTSLGQYADAIADYSHALLINAHYGAAWYNRAVAYHRSGMTQEACADLQHARREQVNVPEVVARKICPTR